MQEYHEFGKITVGEGWSRGVGRCRVAIASADGDVTLAGADGLSSITVDQPVDDVALQQYVLVLSDELLTSYTDSGVELWTATIDDATTLVSVEGDGVVVVLTDDARVVGLDIETGSELFDVAQPHEDFEDVTAVGGTDVCCLTAWSFVSCLDCSGTVTVDENLDSTVEAVAVLDEVVIVALQDGKVVGLDPQSGERQWQSSATIHSITSCGTEDALATTDSGTTLLTAEGRMEETAIPEGRELLGSADGSVIATVNGQKVTFHRHGPSPAEKLKVELLTERLVGTGPLRVYVENDHETDVETTLTIETTPELSLNVHSKEIVLAPGESQEVAYRLTDPPTVDDVDCELIIEETAVEAKTLPVERSLDISTAVEVATTLDHIEGTKPVWTCTVTNTADRELDRIAIGEETEARDVPEGETVSATLTDVQAGSVTVTVEQAGETDAVEVSPDAPEQTVSVDVRRGDGNGTAAIDVVVDGSSTATATGDVAVSVADEIVVERAVEVSPGGQYVLAIPLPPTIASQSAISIAVRSSFLDEQLAVDVDGWGDTEENRQSSPEDGTTAGSAGSASTTQTAGAQSPTGGQQTVHDDQREETASLRVERSVAEECARGATFIEKVRVTNDGTDLASGLTVVADGTTQDVGSLDPGEKQTLVRRHTPNNGDVRLPPLEVRAETNDEEVTATAEETQVAVVDPSIRMEGECVLEDNQLRARGSVTNRTDSPCRLNKFAIDIAREGKGKTWQPDEDPLVKPGEETAFEETIPVDEQEVNLGDCRRIGLGYEFPETELKKINTLAPVVEPTGESMFSGRLTGKTRFVVDKQGVVEVELTNETGAKLTDMTLSVEGPVIKETPMSPDSKAVPTLADGETATLLADIRPETGGNASFEVAVTGQRGEESIDCTLVFSGPVAPSKSAWEEEDYRGQWEMETEGRDGAEQSHLVTRFRPTEAGSHR